MGVIRSNPIHKQGFRKNDHFFHVSAMMLAVPAVEMLLGRARISMARIILFACSISAEDISHGDVRTCMLKPGQAT